MSEQQLLEQNDKSHCKLYISNLDFTFSHKKIQADLRELFTKYGDIISINIVRNQKMRKVYAFVLYNTPQQARQAIDNLDGQYIGDIKLKVEFQRGPKQKRVMDNRRLNSLTCYRCGKAGHFARFCTQKNASDPRKQEHRKQSRRKNRSRSKRRKNNRSSSSFSSSSSSRSYRHRRKSSSSSSSSSSN